MSEKTKRILLHVLFWLGVWAATSLVYGYDKQEAWMAVYTNLVFLPIHMFYFYFMAYFLIPQLLFTRKYFQFGFAVLACILIVPLMNRTVDIFIVEPMLSKYLEQRGFWWEKAQGTTWQRYSNPMYYFNALKGANLVVWAAIVIKYSKMWYERHHAALKAELAFLKGQIHPHFLFNTLNNLYSLTLSKSPKSPEIVLGLSDILRYMLYECNAEYVPLKKDVDALEKYILLEKLRYEERLDLNFSITGDIDGKIIAPLLLLPLVENAFKHGASEKVDQAWISIDLSVKDNLLKFKVANNKAEVLPSDEKKHYGNIGLENVRKRLQIIYPEAHQVRIFDEEELFAVIMEIDLDKRTSLSS